MINNLDMRIVAKMYTEMLNDINKDTHIHSSNKMSFLIVGGQTGAGKSAVIRNLIAEFKQNIVQIDTDEMKKSYPKYEMLLKNDMINAHKIVKPYCDKVVEILETDLIENKYNVLIERTFKDCKKTLESAETFKKNGYEVEVTVVCTNEITSQIGCIFRYESDIVNDGIGRKIEKESHDEIYKNIPTTIRDFVNSPYIDNVKICDRQAILLAESSKGDDVVKVYEESRQFVDYEYLESQIYLIEYMMKMRNASDEELKEVDGIYNQLQDHKMQHSNSNNSEIEM